MVCLFSCLPAGDSMRTAISRNRYVKSPYLFDLSYDITGILHSRPIKTWLLLEGLAKIKPKSEEWMHHFAKPCGPLGLGIIFAKPDGNNHVCMDLECSFYYMLLITLKRFKSGLFSSFFTYYIWNNRLLNATFVTLMHNLTKQWRWKKNYRHNKYRPSNVTEMTPDGQGNSWFIF